MGATVAAYLLDRHAVWDALLETLRCPRCRRTYRWHQVRDRAAWTDCEHAERIPVLRIRCPTCRATRTLLPDFLTPRRRYQNAPREAVLAAETPATHAPCDTRTARRWLQAFAAAITDGIGTLIGTVLQPLGVGRQDPAVLALEAPSLASLRQVRALAPACDASSLLGWANQRLTTAGVAAL
jgi:hypothetical protein